MKKMKTVAIDGPAGAGKSTVSKLAAQKLGYTYIDTGAMYRAVAYKTLKNGKNITTDEIISITQNIDIDLRYADGVNKVFVDGENVTSEIRTPEVSRLASEVAKIGFVREKLTELQRKMAKRGGVIMDGRDIGTIVVPDACCKLFITADLRERAKRRYDELKQKGETCDLAKIEQEIEERDHRDMTREISPLKQADDAVLVDTSDLGIEEVVKEISKIISGKTGA